MRKLTLRRIIVSCNVQGRDLATVVREPGSAVDAAVLQEVRATVAELCAAYPLPV